MTAAKRHRIERLNLEQESSNRGGAEPAHDQSRQEAHNDGACRFTEHAPGQLPSVRPERRANRHFALARLCQGFGQDGRAEHRQEDRDRAERPEDREAKSLRDHLTEQLFVNGTCRTRGHGRVELSEHGWELSCGEVRAFAGVNDDRPRHRHYRLLCEWPVEDERRQVRHAGDHVRDYADDLDRVGLAVTMEELPDAMSDRVVASGDKSSQRFGDNRDQGGAADVRLGKIAAARHGQSHRRK